MANKVNRKCRKVKRNSEQEEEPISPKEQE